MSPLATNLMTDIKGKVSAPLPYKLVPSSAHFRALVSGRRKATEVSVKNTSIIHSL